MSQKVDFLIVGGGASGRLLQLELMKRGKSTLVIDDCGANRCTKIAAGLANPLIGKYFTIGWRVPEFFSDLRSYYEELELRLNATFFRPCDLHRIISNPGEQNTWLSKAHKDKYKGFCKYQALDFDGLSNPYGVITVDKGGEMNTRSFLEACEKQLPTMDTRVNYEKLNAGKSKYEGIEYTNTIFCEGYEVMYNPWFKDLVNIVPTKGEILEIETDLQPKGDIFLGGVFIQHIENKRWRVGSTYAPKDTSINPTKEKKNEMLSRLNNVLKLEYQVVNHKVGTRPASKDRRPICGVHPEISNLYVFNGMGSKAVSMAPRLSTEMCDFILEGTPLDQDINLTRFEK